MTRSGAVRIIKIGGRLCEDPGLVESLAAAAASLPGKLVLVHGGGRSVSRLQEALGIVPRFVDGRRITAPEEVTAVEMALSGAVNKSLVRALGRAGRPAVGLSGSDGPMLTCAPVPGLGAVGEPIQVKLDLLRLLLEAGYTPVFSPVSVGLDGEALNVNADEAAAALAIGLEADRLDLLSDVPGVLDSGSCLEEISEAQIEELIALGTVTGGMIVKLRAAARASRSGVGRVGIGRYAGGPLDGTTGTRITTSGGRKELHV